MLKTLLQALLALAILGIAGCTYSKSYFRIGPDGKMIKASGPITPEELAGEEPVNQLLGGTVGTTTGAAVEEPKDTEGEEEDGQILPGDTTGGGSTGGGSTGGETTGGRLLQ